MIAASCTAAHAQPLLSYRVAGDAIPSALVAAPGDAARGRAVVAGRDANCLLCHAVPDPTARFAGNLAPSLDGVGARLSEGQLRLRIVDSAQLNRDTIMPSYYRTDGLARIGEAWRGKPILSAQEIEDTVAYLKTLQ